MKLAALIKKEFVRFFRDPKLLITMIVPGILIYILYSIIGNFIWTEPDYDYRVYVLGSSAQVERMIELAVGKEEWSMIPAEDGETAKEEVKDGKASAFVVFPENFDDLVAQYDPASGLAAPCVSIYYRSADEESLAFYTLATAVLDAYESAIANKFDVNAGDGFDLSPEGGMAANIMGSVLPFIVVAFVFSACMSVTLESVAGEKERGTLATILVTSVKRSHVALGKVIPLSGISLIGACSSFLGVALSMPKLIGTSLGSVVVGFGFSSYLLLLLLIFSIVPLIVAGISALSAYAHTVKEASAYTGVVMIVVMVLSVVSSFVTNLGGWIVAVPVLNAVVCMQNILTMSLSVWQSLVSVACNLVYTAIFLLLLTKMLGSEKIMFGK